MALFDFHEALEEGLALIRQLVHHFLVESAGLALHVEGLFEALELGPPHLAASALEVLAKARGAGLNGRLRHQHGVELCDGDGARRAPLFEPLTQVLDVLHLLVAKGLEDATGDVVLGILNRFRVGPMNAAFVLEGGIDGLLYITDMSWKRIKHPSEIVNVADEIDVKVLKFDRDRTRVSLGLKQMGEDPWEDITRRYPVGARLSGVITNLTDYGCFVEIEEGVEGLVHVSEMDWTNKNVNPNKLVQVGTEVEVVVLDIDAERRRISLGMKQCQANPWDDFASSHNKGDKIVGTIKSITDFGVFIGLAGGIDGLVHLSDISWNEVDEEAVRNYKNGDEIETVILAIDPERERISLGIKQLEQDPFSNFLAENPKGTIIKCEIIEVDAKGALVKLSDSVEGYIRASEIARDRVEDARTMLKVGEEVEAKFIGVDRKNRTVNLSIKAKDHAEEAEAIEGYSKNTEGAGATTLGDLLKEQMENKENS